MSSTSESKRKFPFPIHQSTWAVLFAFISMFVLGLADNIRGPLFPEVLEYFNLTSAKGSWSFAATSAAALLGSWSSLYFLKRYTISTLLLMAVVSMGFGVFIMGYAAQFWVFIVGSFFLGVSIGWMSVSQNLLVSESVTVERKSRALSGLHSIYGLASFVAPVLAALITSRTESWRSTFILISALCVVYLIVHGFVRAEPSFPIVQNIEEDKIDKTRISLISLFSIGGLFAFYVVAEILIGTRLAQYMRNYYSMDLLRSSEYVTYFFLFLLIGRVIFAFNKFPLSTKLQMNISLAISLILLILGLNSHPIILTLVGLSMAPFYPLCVTYISEVTGVHARKFLTFSITFQSAAVVSMHLGVGYLTDTLGLLYAFGVGIFALILSLVCLNLHPQKLY